MSENTSSFRYYVTNPLSMMTISVHFYSTIHVKHILVSQLQYTREFMRSVKGALKRSRRSSGYFSQIGKVVGITLLNVLPWIIACSAFVYIAVSNEGKLQTWADSYTRQWRVRQKTTMANTGTLPHYLYSNKISEVAKTTEAYTADIVRSSDVEKKVLKRDWAT